MRRRIKAKQWEKQLAIWAQRPGPSLADLVEIEIGARWSCRHLNSLRSPPTPRGRKGSQAQWAASEEKSFATDRVSVALEQIRQRAFTTRISSLRNWGPNDRGGKWSASEPSEFCSRIASESNIFLNIFELFFNVTLNTSTRRS